MLFCFSLLHSKSYINVNTCEKSALIFHLSSPPAPHLVTILLTVFLFFTVKCLLLADIIVNINGSLCVTHIYTTWKKSLFVESIFLLLFYFIWCCRCMFERGERWISKSQLQISAKKRERMWQLLLAVTAGERCCLKMFQFRVIFMQNIILDKFRISSWIDWCLKYLPMEFIRKKLQNVREELQY